MNTEIKELPENWAIQGGENLKEYFDKIECMYSGANDIYFYTKIDGIWQHIDDDTHYTVVPFEQWHASVNKKEEIPNVGNADVLICSNCKDALHMDKITCPRCGCLSKEIKKEETTWANPYEMIAKMMGDERKQPRLKVGDNIPEYLNERLWFKGNGYGSWYKGLTISDNYAVDSIEDCYYVYKNTMDSGYLLKISEVDALIEEHERERKEPPKNHFATLYNSSSLNPYSQKETEEWIPKNGEEVNCYDKNGAWVDVGNYIGMDEKVFIVKIETGFDWFANVKPIVSKKKSEIADLLGISKEQLKIVEG